MVSEELSVFGDPEVSGNQRVSSVLTINGLSEIKGPRVSESRKANLEPRVSTMKGILEPKRYLETTGSLGTENFLGSKVSGDPRVSRNIEVFEDSMGSVDLMVS